MSLLVWNCCGLGNLRTGKELEVLIRAKDPSVVFLAETWADEARLKEVQRNIKFDNLFYVERNLRGGGGLAIYWKNSIDVHVDSFSKYHIDSIINKGSDEAWRFTSFYGEPATHRRMEAWNKLRLLNTKHNLPWLCAGDFNEIIRQSEKLGGNNRSQTQMQLFRDVIDECGFLDLGYVGDQFTWRKHFADGHSLWERLDRGLANHDWFMRFSGTKIHHLHSDSSDHSPLWITLDGLDIPSFSKPFRFEEMWLSDRGCSDIVEAVWLSREEGDVHDHVIHKIDKCGKELRVWNKNCFGNVRGVLSRKRKELKEAEKVAMRSGSNLQVRELKKEIADLVDKENRLWFQRSKIMWAKFGDRNSKFFHSQASQRKRKNLIRKIKDSNGRVVEDNEGIAECLVQYYQNLLSSTNQQFCASATESIQTVITEDMNSKLSSAFTPLEVKQAINQMAPLKAPGPDGMPPLFYQHYWNLIGDDISNTVLHYLNSATLPEHLNHTFLTLIPKKKNPEFASEFRPISLCNVLYKIFSKVLANRLKKILPNIITENQSAFTKSRLISDNILVAFESLHSMQRHTGKEGYMAIKLDMSKAYDRVEWTYLQSVMEKMGFTDHWINLMMLCVKTVTYSILVNGEPKGMITPTRGIRQGDPLSPFLFLLCTEGLNGLLNNAAHQGHIKGYSLCRNSPRLTHLLFADDSLLFCRATIEECHRVLNILEVYGKCSGQQINRSKTTIFFSKSTKVDSRNQIKLALGVPEIIQYEKYLGLPSLVGRNKKASFNYIKERVWKKLQGWKEKLLSQAGREILIKAVVQAIPTYTMSCFKLPVGLCSEIESLIRRFWWGQKGERRKVHWVKWDTLCLPKKEGGMGFKDLANFNDALLAKQAWRLLHNKDSLFYRVFKMKFFPNCSIWEAQDSSLGSHAWHSILKGRDVLLKGARWRVGCGEAISIWNDAWLPSQEHPRVLSDIVPGFEDSRVSDLINPSTRTWDVNLVHGLLSPEEAALVLSIPLSRTPMEDKIIWPFNPSGNYTVNSGSKFLAKLNSMFVPAGNSQQQNGVWKLIWGLNVPSKVRNFMWRVCKEAIPTKHNLLKRKILNEDRCEQCGLESETAVHALWNCSTVDEIWESTPGFEDRSQLGASNIMDLINLAHDKRKNVELMAMVLWTIWHRRNKLRVSSNIFPKNQVFQQASQALTTFQQSQQSLLNQAAATRAQNRTQWRPPPENCVKLNFDGAIFPELGKAGIGVVAHDSQGNAIASLSKQAPLPFSPVIVEAMAAARAITFAQELGLNEFMIEGDSEAVINTLQSMEASLTTYGHLLESAKSSLVTNKCIAFNHIRRSGNRVAHNLAKHARHVRGLSVWVEDIPPHLHDVLFVDPG